MSCPAWAIGVAILATLWAIGQLAPCSERIDGARVCPETPSVASESPAEPTADPDGAQAMAPAEPSAELAPEAPAPGPEPGSTASDEAQPEAPAASDDPAPPVPQAQGAEPQTPEGDAAQPEREAVELPAPWPDRGAAAATGRSLLPGSGDPFRELLSLLRSQDLEDLSREEGAPEQP